jgi:hypothetical protein
MSVVPSRPLFDSRRIAYIRTAATGVTAMGFTFESVENNLAAKALQTKRAIGFRVEIFNGRLKVGDGADRSIIESMQKSPDISANRIQDKTDLAILSITSGGRNLVGFPLSLLFHWQVWDTDIEKLRSRAEVALKDLAARSTINK